MWLINLTMTSETREELMSSHYVMICCKPIIEKISHHLQTMETISYNYSPEDWKIKQEKNCK